MWKKTALALLMLFVAAATAGARNDLWLHVAVDEVASEERVRVNVPFSLVEAILPLIDEREFHGGRIVIEDAEFHREDILNVLEALRDAADGEYVTVEGRHEWVRVAKEGEYISVKVQEQHHRGDGQVDVRIPVAVLDALVSGGDGELDVMAAIEVLGEQGEGDLVAVDDAGTTVRIWVDDSNTSD